jgi:hypothetical protein
MPGINYNGENGWVDLVDLGAEFSAANHPITSQIQIPQNSASDSVG